MNDALCVRGLESSCDLQGECKSFRWRNGQIFMLFSRDDRIAVNKLHHDVVRADVINLADVGMVERGNRSRFAFKTLGELCSRDLDCNQAIQACISCPIHFAHAACTNSGFYAVWSELCTGSDLRGRWNQLGSGCLLPCGMVEHPFTRGPLRQQSFNAASHLGIRIRQQRLTLFAGLLQRGVVQLLHLLPVFRVRLRAPAIRANVIARSRAIRTVARLSQARPTANFGATFSSPDRARARPSVAGTTRQTFTICQVGFPDARGANSTSLAMVIPPTTIDIPAALESAIANESLPEILREPGNYPEGEHPASDPRP